METVKVEMTKQEDEILVTVRQVEIQELARLLDSIAYPDVTFNEDMLTMAHQAIRLSKLRATEARNILYRWEGVL